jgi:hypothetical protein
MRPVISSTTFGSITIDGMRYSHDVYLSADGNIRKRKKKLSKRKYGTSHKISQGELEYILDDGVKRLLIGTGQYGRACLSQPAQDLLATINVAVALHPTPEACQIWNEDDEIDLGLFHVTC